MLKDDLNSPRLRHASSQDKRWSISMFLLFILRDELIISPHVERSWRLIFMHNLSSPKTSKSRDLPFIYSVRNYSLIFLRTNIQSGLAKKHKSRPWKMDGFFRFCWFLQWNLSQFRLRTRTRSEPSALQRLSSPQREKDDKPVTIW